MKTRTGAERATHGFPWKLRPEARYRLPYAAARSKGNAERLRATAVTMAALFSALVIQLVLSPGTTAGTPFYAAYLTVYLCFIAGSAAYPLASRLGSRRGESPPAQWLLVALILLGTTTLAVMDSANRGDQAAMLLGLVATAIVFRSGHAVFLASTFACFGGYALGMGLLGALPPEVGFWLPLALEILSIDILSIALGHYDIRDVTLRLELDETLAERGILFRELQHRVKNSLAMVSSLLSLEEGKLGDPALLEVLRRAQDRISTMSAVYERLYEAGDIDATDLGAYLRYIVAMLSGPEGIDGNRIPVGLSMPDFRMDLRRAIPLGLLVNELLTNSIKHAFPGGRTGRVSIEFRTEGAKTLLRVGDDGVGLPEGSPADSPVGLGMQLIPLLAEQAGTGLRYLGPPGFGVELELPS